MDILELMKSHVALSVPQPLLLLGFFGLVPWATFGVFATDMLPVHWQFGQWPVGVRSALILLFVLFNVLDFGFSVWWFFGWQELEGKTRLSA